MWFGGLWWVGAGVILCQHSRLDMGGQNIDGLGFNLWGVLCVGFG